MGISLSVFFLVFSAGCLVSAVKKVSRDGATHRERQKDSGNLFKDMIDRQKGEGVHARIEFKELHGTTNIAAEVGMAQHGPLGTSGRSRGVEDECRVERLSLRQRRCRCLLEIVKRDHIGPAGSAPRALAEGVCYGCCGSGGFD